METSPFLVVIMLKVVIMIKLKYLLLIKTLYINELNKCCGGTSVWQLIGTVDLGKTHQVF